MPQNDMTYEGRRRETHRSSCKPPRPAMGFVNGAIVNHAHQQNQTADTLNAPTPKCLVTAYANHGYQGKRRKAPPPKTLKNQGRTISAVSDASAAGRVSGADIPDGVSVTGAPCLGSVALPRAPDQITPAPRRSAAAKRPRKNAARAKSLPPKEAEDWEKEIQEVTLPDWGELCFGTRPYGPEDVLHFDLQDLTLQQTNTVYPSVTAGYRPDARHPRPVRWSRCRTPTEPDQFADADEQQAL